MIFTKSLSLILALAPVTLLAAPFDSIAKRGLSGKALEFLESGDCDLSAASLPTDVPLPPPSAGLYLSHIALGRGTQNYTCSSKSVDVKPKAVGAIAQLYNLTCTAVRVPWTVSSTVFTAYAEKYPPPSGQAAQYMLSGHHEFTDKGVPLFLLETDAVNYGYVQAKPNASIPAPLRAVKESDAPGTLDVPWLKLNATEGDYKEVYRVNTVGGLAPDNCTDIEGDFTREYAAVYWFYKG